MCMNELIFEARQTLQNMNTLRDSAPSTVAAVRHAINFLDGCSDEQYEALVAVCKTAESLGGMADDEDVKTAVKLKTDIDSEQKLVAQLRACFTEDSTAGTGTGGWTNTGVKCDAMAEGNEQLSVCDYYQGVVAGDYKYYQSASDIRLEPLLSLTTKAKTQGMKTRAGKTALRMAVFVLQLRKAVALALHTKKWRPVERLCQETTSAGESGSGLVLPTHLCSSLASVFLLCASSLITYSFAIRITISVCSLPPSKSC
jgi:hypothetical protein